MNRLISLLLVFAACVPAVRAQEETGPRRPDFIELIRSQRRLAQEFARFERDFRRLERQLHAGTPSDQERAGRYGQAIDVCHMLALDERFADAIKVLHGVATRPTSELEKTFEKIEEVGLGLERIQAIIHGHEQPPERQCRDRRSTLEDKIGDLDENRILGQLESIRHGVSRNLDVLTEEIVEFKLNEIRKAIETRRIGTMMIRQTTILAELLKLLENESK